jgi:predicted DNA-binding protein YlxM (UPF0122 family)
MKHTRRVKKTVTNFYLNAVGLHAEEMARRNYTIAMLKHIACYQMRRDDFTIVEIADAFNLDHSTVVYAIEKITDIIESDYACKMLYKFYISRLAQLMRNAMTYNQDIRNFTGLEYTINKHKFKRKDNCE